MRSFNLSKYFLLLSNGSYVEARVGFAVSNLDFNSPAYVPSGMMFLAAVFCGTWRSLHTASLLQRASPR